MIEGRSGAFPGGTGQECNLRVTQCLMHVGWGILLHPTEEMRKLYLKCRRQATHRFCPQTAVSMVVVWPLPSWRLGCVSSLKALVRTTFKDSLNRFFRLLPTKK